MLPQALGGAGSEFRAVMAIVTMGGVLFSAIFTLYAIPVIYDIFDALSLRGAVLRIGRWVRSWVVG